MVTYRATYAQDLVAPHAGAWIEIYHLRPSRASHPVAPHAGAWIEMLS